MFINPSFENGHWFPTKENVINGWHFADSGGASPIVELQLPVGWGFRWADETIPNPYSTDPWNRFKRPEVRVLSEGSLPANEKELFIVDGSHTLKIFRGYGAWYGAIYQDLELDGGLYIAKVNIFNDAVARYDDNKKIPALDSHACQIRIVINDSEPSEWRPLFPQNMNAEEFLFSAEGNTRVALEIMMPFALNNSGIFTDAESIIEIIADQHQGAPRVQYERTYVLLPPNADLDWVHAAANGTWEAHAYTIGNSADDAGIGDLDARRIIVINPDEWGPGEDGKGLRGFYDTHYPNVDARQVIADSPGMVESLLSHAQFEDLGVLEPYTAEPPPPPPPPPPASLFTLPTFHLQATFPGWLDILAALHAEGRPVRWVKLVAQGMEWANDIKRVSPKTKVVYRHWIAHQQPYLDGNPIDEANRFLNHFWEGITLNPIDAVESLNETIATGDIVGIDKTVAFDIAFAEEVYRRSGGHVAPVTLTAPPGNPQHGAEVRRLIPAVQATITAGGYLGPHTYMAARPEPDTTERWLEEEGLHYHLRPLLSWDVEFNAAGLYPKYLFGETGAVGVHIREDGRPGGFAGQEIGWRSSACLNGNLPRYVAVLLRYAEQIIEWNAEHGDRCEAYMVFTSGGIGWLYFQFNSEWRVLYGLS